MIIVSPSLIVVSIFCLIFFGTIWLILLLKPKLGQKIIERAKVPWVYWPDEGAGGIFILITLLLFVLFSCTLCSQIFGLIQKAGI